MYCLLAGVIAIVSAVILPRINGVPDAGLYGSFTILAISGVLIIYYTISVKSSIENLTQDAADYAYYLGFSLTIVALVSVFMTDGVEFFLGNRKGVSTGIQTILLQFGAGLAATMIGVVARIYLLDIVSQEDTPLDQSISELKYAIRELIYSLGEENEKYTHKVSQSINTLTSTIGDINSSAVLLSNVMKNSAETLEKVFDIADLEANVKGISDKLKSTLTTVDQTGQLLIQSVAQLNDSITNFGDGLNKASQPLSAYQAMLSGVNEQLLNSNNQLTQVNGSLDNLGKVLPFVSNDMQSFNISLAAFQTSFESIKQSISELDQKFNLMKSSADDLSQEFVSTINFSKSSEAQVAQSLEKMRANIDLLSSNLGRANDILIDFSKTHK